MEIVSVSIDKRLIDAVNLDDPQAKRWKSDISVARMAYADGKLKDAERIMYRALEVAKQLKERSFAVGTCHLGLAVVCTNTDRNQEAKKHFEAALKEAKGTDVPSQELRGVTLHYYGLLAWDENNLGEARRMLEESMEILRDAGSPAAYFLALTLCDLSALTMEEGDFAGAQPLIKSAIEILSVVENIESSDYVKACTLFEANAAKVDEAEFLELWLSGATKVQYQLGSTHPELVRSLNRFAKMAQKLSKQDLLDEARQRFTSLAV
jgi:tetratricopeptide (TPR) repeat protein